MKRLPETFRKNGYDYEMVCRTDLTVLYAQRLHGRTVCHEVCRIQSHQGRIIGGLAVPAAEYLPSTEQWGRLAWSCGPLERALKRFDEQEALQLARFAHAA